MSNNVSKHSQACYITPASSAVGVAFCHYEIILYSFAAFITPRVLHLIMLKIVN